MFSINSEKYQRPFCSWKCTADHRIADQDLGTCSFHEPTLSQLYDLTAIKPSDPHALLHAAMIIAFPINFFFAFLFYTDSGAVFFVLLMYYLAERVNLLAYPSARGSYVFSALVRPFLS